MMPASRYRRHLQARMAIHRKLIEDLNKNITLTELEGLKNVSMDSVRRSSVSQTGSTRELLQLLENKGVIAVGEYGELRTIIHEQMKASVLVHYIDKAERELRDLDRQNAGK